MYFELNWIQLSYHPLTTTLPQADIQPSSIFIQLMKWDYNKNLVLVWDQKALSLWPRAFWPMQAPHLKMCIFGMGMVVLAFIPWSVILMDRKVKHLKTRWQTSHIWKLYISTHSPLYRIRIKFILSNLILSYLILSYLMNCFLVLE